MNSAEATTALMLSLIKMCHKADITSKDRSWALTAAWGALAHDALMQAKDLPAAHAEAEAELRAMLDFMTRTVEEWQPEDPRLTQAVERGDVDAFVNLVKSGNLRGKTHG